MAPVIGELYERSEFPYEIVAGMGEMGLFGLPFPEEYGGMGGDYFALCLALEELARVDSSVAITLEAGVGLGAMPIYRFGTEAQKQEWLPRLCAGTMLGAFGLTEPGGGSDAGATRTTRPAGGRHVGDQRHQVLHHQLRHRHHRPGHRHRGHRPGAGRPARDLRHHRAGRHAGLHGLQEVLEGGVVGVGHPGAVVRRLPGARGQPARASGGGATPSSCRSSTRAASPSPPCRSGLAQGCVDECLRYVDEREAFGHKIGEYQVLQFKLADMEARTHVARLAYYDAAARLMAGRPFKKQAAIAKLVSSDAAMVNAREATQIFGGYGFMNETPVGRFYRDAKVLEIGEGTSEVQRMLIARELGLPARP